MKYDLVVNISNIIGVIGVRPSTSKQVNSILLYNVKRCRKLRKFSSLTPYASEMFHSFSKGCAAEVVPVMAHVAIDSSNVFSTNVCRRFLHATFCTTRVCSSSSVSVSRRLVAVAGGGGGGERDSTSAVAATAD